MSSPPTRADQITIRALVPGEGESYRKIRLEALRDCPEAFGASYDDEAASPLGAAEERIASGYVFAAFDGDKIVGMAGFKRYSGAKQAHKGMLWGMYLSPNYRGRGISKGLVQAVLDRAAGTVERVSLAVVSDNKAALGLYQRMGFEIYGTEPEALKLGERYLAEILMTRSLANR